MLPRALKHASLAAALLLPTLATVALAPPAFAALACHSGGAQPCNGNGFLLGEAQLDMEHNSTASGCSADWHNYYSVTAATGGTFDPSSFGEQTNYHWVPGMHATLYFNWDTTRGPCTSQNATSATITLSTWGFGQQGTTSWNQSISGTKSYASHDIYFDNNAFTGGGGTAIPAGQYFVTIQLNGNAEDGATNGPSQPYAAAGTANTTVTNWWAPGEINLG